MTLIFWILKCGHFAFNVCSLKHGLMDTWPNFIELINDNYHGNSASMPIKIQNVTLLVKQNVLMQEEPALSWLGEFVAKTTVQKL